VTPALRNCIRNSGSRSAEYCLPLQVNPPASAVIPVLNARSACNAPIDMMLFACP